MGLLAGQRVRFGAALVALAVGSSMNLLLPELVRVGLKEEWFSWVLAHLPVVLGGVAALFVLQGLAFYLRSLLFGLIGQRVYADVRARLFQAIVTREVEFFESARSGDLAARIGSDAALVQEAVSIKLSVLLRYGLQVLVGIVLMLWMSWQMTTAIVLSVLAMIAVSALFIRRLRGASREYQGQLARLVAFATECFAGAKVMRALAAEADACARFGVLNDTARRAGERRTAIAAAFSSGASVLLNVLLLLVLWYGISLVMGGALSLNDLAAFVLYGAIVAVSFSFLVSAYVDLMQSIGGLERVFELLDQGCSQQPLRTPPRRFLGNGSAESDAGLAVELREVSFAYPSRPDALVLDRLSVYLRAGATTAIVGPSGSGKSSLVQLLLGFYRPQAGTVLINGAALETHAEEELRAQVAWVPQEPYLFGFSVYENVLFGNPGLTRAEVVARMAEWEFLDFIAELPQGVDTVLGEQGAQLSGGQRQRIAIARALLRAPALLLLDEATSGLDSDSEEQVLTTIRTVLPRCTVVVISHRLATVRRADVTYVISAGQIVQHGTHEELKAAQGLYRQYVMHQALE